MIYDLITIGGGAAGFFGAITHAEHGGGSTLIVERAARTLGKVKISGGGRCNVTHACFEPREFTKHYPRGAKALLGPLHRFGVEDTISPITRPWAVSSSAGSSRTSRSPPSIHWRASRASS